MVLFNLLLAVLASLMRWQIGGAPDGQGQGSGDGSGGGTATQTPPATPPAPAPNNPDNKTQTFSQADVDRIVKERLEREKGKYSDYDDLKQKASKYDELEASKKSDLDKEKERADKAEAQAQQAIATANARLIVAEIKAQAAGKKVRAEAIDMLVAALASNPEIKIEDDGTVKGVDKVLDEYLKGKDFLLEKATPGSSGAEFGGREQKTLAEQIAEAESKGDWRLANRLKMTQMRQGGGSQA